jgi:hypothetical protein
LDLSGNTTAQTFCENAFNLAAERDISGALLADSDITDYSTNNLVYLGSNDMNVQKTFLSANENSTKAQLIALNAYEMTLGKNNQIPLVSNLGIMPPFAVPNETKIVASDKQADDNFGWSVAISGNYAIVGAYLEDPDGVSNAGSAYIFERDTNGTWSQGQKIVASDKADNDAFGYSVAISGNYAAVGARDNNNTGAAYIFERENGSWTQKQKLVASDAQLYDQFGNDISISGNYVIVCAVSEDISNDDKSSGAAYIFERNTNGTWSQKSKIFHSDREKGDNLCSVSIDASYAIVGVKFEDPNSTHQAGSAYIFERNTNGTWSQKQKIVASDRASTDYFGISVSISGNYAIVGALNEDQDANGDNTLSNTGSAYIFERNTNGTWNETQKIVASDRGSTDNFGISVSISGNYAIVGALNEDQDANGDNTLSNTGSAYIFERNTNGTWNETQKIVASDRGAGDKFGNSVAISGNYAIVGAHYEDPDGSGNAGSAYIFEG